MTQRAAPSKGSLALHAAALFVACAAQTVSAERMPEPNAAMSGAPMAYVLADEGVTLATFPSLGESGTAFLSPLSTALAAIDYRPSTGELLGYARSGAIYSVDPLSGVLTDLNAVFDSDDLFQDGPIAVDVNTQIDAMRALGADGSNRVYFPASFADERAGSVRRSSDLFYAQGDWNAGLPPMIFANAYTNAVTGLRASSTVQYALDARTDALVQVASDVGELRTVARISVQGTPADLLAVGGFDILSPEPGADLAFAVLHLEGQDVPAVYRVDLDTGEAVRFAELDLTGLTGFAVSRGGW